MSEKKASAHDCFNQGLPDRFWDKIEFEPNSGCWIWVGCYNQHGYGRFWWGGKMQRAHRVSYEVHKGIHPDDLELDHLCRVRCCVNPDHLEAVTHKENIRRGDWGKHNSKKTHCPYGHECNAENTRLYRGGRFCLACEMERSRQRWAKQKLERQAALLDTNGTQL